MGMHALRGLGILQALCEALAFCRHCAISIADREANSRVVQSTGGAHKTEVPLPTPRGIPWDRCWDVGGFRGAPPAPVSGD